MTAPVTTARVKNGLSKLTAPVTTARVMTARVKNGHSKLNVPAKSAVLPPRRNCALKMARQKNALLLPQSSNPPPLWLPKLQKHQHPRQSLAHRALKSPWQLPRLKVSLTSN
jgi:hypothetical protein